VFQAVSISPFDEMIVDIAVIMNSALKRKRKQLDLADLFFAATAAAHGLFFATLNTKHFDRIDTLCFMIQRFYFDTSVFWWCIRHRI
jgi:tRNA(fMet)-specific endonuclease VapC